MDAPGDKLFVRRMCASDLPALSELLADPEVMRYLEPPLSAERSRAFLAREGLSDPPRVWAVADARDTLVGYVIYHGYDERSIELGWVLRRDLWGQGHATDLARELLTWAERDGRDAVIECVSEQRATAAIARRLGFAYVGREDGLDVWRRALRP